jgi:hypothetical protein
MAGIDQLTPFQKILKTVLCNAEYAQCKADEAGQAIAKAVQTAGQWIADNAGAIIGTILIVGAIALIVVVVISTGGAAAPALALI